MFICQNINQHTNQSRGSNMQAEVKVNKLNQKQTCWQEARLFALKSDSFNLKPCGRCDKSHQRERQAETLRMCRKTCESRDFQAFLKMQKKKPWIQYVKPLTGVQLLLLCGGQSWSAEKQLWVFFNLFIKVAFFAELSSKCLQISSDM